MVRVIATGASSAFVARRARYALPARQRVDAVTSTSTVGSGSEPVVRRNQSNATVTGVSCSGPIAMRPILVSGTSLVTGSPSGVQLTPPSLTRAWYVVPTFSRRRYQ